MIKVYLQMDKNFENIEHLSTVQQGGTHVEAILEDPNVNLSELFGYSVEMKEDKAYHMIFDQEKYDKIKHERDKEQAIKEAEAMVEERSTQAVLLAADDESAYKMRYLYDEWKPLVKYNVGNRNLFNDNLYKCKQAHTSEDGPDRTPDKLPALWDLIALEDPTLGTKDNPIKIPEPFSSMVYVKGKYYLENETLYLMNRAGMEDGEEISLTFKPSQLVGHYFDKA